MGLRFIFMLTRNDRTVDDASDQLQTALALGVRHSGFKDIGLPPFDKDRDRVMLCGGPSVLVDLKNQLLARGFEEGSIAKPGDFVLERAFVET